MNDYEIISNHREYMSDINLGYIPTFDIDNNLINLILIPFTIKNMQLKYVNIKKVEEITNKLNEICINYNLNFKFNDKYIELLF